MNKQAFFLIFFFVFLVSFFILRGQQQPATEKKQERGNIRLMFYNTENFFDIENDTLHNDEEYLPTAGKKWNYAKYLEKTRNIYQVIAATGGIQPPEIIGFAEIENRKVLDDLIRKTPLEKYKYAVIHSESPDVRGIDVGLIYRSDKIKCLKYDFIKVIFPLDRKKTTRDIIYFKALINKDTLHLFVNHWPSRLGGQKKSNPNRYFVSQLLRQKVDSLLKINSCAKILITGDFNDQPRNESLSLVLDAKKPTIILQCSDLYNLSWALKDSCKCGTYRYGAQWNMLDQFIISGSLLIQTSLLSTCRECVHIADFNFLLIEDTKYGGSKPFRTYQGPLYMHGFSDHLPIYIDLFF